MKKDNSENIFKVKCLKSFRNYGREFLKNKEYIYQDLSNDNLEFLKKMIDKGFLIELK